MKKLVAVLFFLHLLLMVNSCFARIGATGCLIISEKKVYTVLGSKGIYNRTATSVSAAYCDWTPTTGSACNVCSQNLAGNGNCNGTLIAGVSNSFVEMCPIDDGIGYLLVIVAGVGSLIIHHTKRNVITSI